MRYYIIGNKDSLSIEYAYAEQWLKLNNNIVINPCNIRIDGIDNEELQQIKMRLLAFSDGVLVLNKSCDSYELEYAKVLGKKVKYLSKQWKLKRKESRETYKSETANGSEEMELQNCYAHKNMKEIATEVVKNGGK